jgi:hypothetical protein
MSLGFESFGYSQLASGNKTREQEYACNNRDLQILCEFQGG